MKKTILACCMLLGLATASMHAQVTIGKKESPVKGALLQLKNKDELTPGGANADKGMMLPRVQLQAIDKLSPILPVGYNASEEPKYAGMMVFNTSDATRDLCSGVYVWTLSGWQRVPKPCFATGVYPGTLTFYKSALLAKNITVESTFPGTVSFVDDALAAINWKSGGFPNTGSVTGSTTFSFQPSPNPGADKNATVQIAINTSEGVENKSVNIIHLDREMEFTSPTGAYPALGATHSLAIKSEAPWSAAISATNPATMVTALADNSQPEGDTNMKVTLANNDTWAERIAKLNITSSNGDFLPRTMDVKQSSSIPNIIFTAPAPDTNGNIVVDITGKTVADPSVIKFQNNSNWVYWQDNNSDPAGLNDWTMVFQGTPAVENTGGQGTQFVESELRFYPQATGNHLPAGTELKSNLLLVSQSHGTAPEIRRNMLVKRTVPARTGAVVPTPAWGAVVLMPSGGTEIKLSTSTNTAWKAYYQTVDEVNSAIVYETGPNVAIGASNYGAKELKLRSPTFKEWDKPRRLVNIMHSFDGIYIEKISAYWLLSYNLGYTMGGYTNLPSTANNADAVIPQAGKWYKVDMISNSETPNFRMYTNDMTTGFGTGLWVDPAEYPLSATGRDVYVPANNSWVGRGVGINYSKPGWNSPGNPSSWVTIKSYVQPGWDLKKASNATDIRISGVFYNGATHNAYVVTAQGAPNFRILVQYGDGEASNLSNYVAAPASGGSFIRTITVPFSVKPNNSVNTRAINIYFEKVGYKNAAGQLAEWELLATSTQAGQPWVEAGTWVFHRTPVTVHLGGKVNPNSATLVSQACVNAYGAEWQAYWRGMFTGRPEDKFDSRTEVYNELWYDDLTSIPWGDANVGFALNIGENSHGSFYGEAEHWAYRYIGNSRNNAIRKGSVIYSYQNNSSFAQLENSTVSVMCAKRRP